MLLPQILIAQGGIKQGSEFFIFSATNKAGMNVALFENFHGFHLKIRHHI